VAFIAVIFIQHVHVVSVAFQQTTCTFDIGATKIAAGSCIFLVLAGVAKGRQLLSRGTYDFDIGRLCGESASRTRFGIRFS
jgi:hypothetical protein